jgi:membrane complex biogenesis BtpA family protein
MAKESDFKLSGVLHLPPLPGSPAAVLGFEQIVDHALRDADALVSGGIHRCVIENFGDAPFRRETVQPHVSAMLAIIGRAVRERLDMEVGINILRNDAHAAMGAAVACGAMFVRVNVLVGAAWTDQGLIQGEAASLARYRRSLCGHAQGPHVYADVNVKHAVPAGESDIGLLAVEAVERAGADGIIVTGARTGAPTDLNDVIRVRDAVGSHPIWVGSGVNQETISDVARVADGAIVGTWLHRGGQLTAPIDKDRVRALVGASRS